MQFWSLLLTSEILDFADIFLTWKFACGQRLTFSMFALPFKFEQICASSDVLGWWSVGEVLVKFKWNFTKTSWSFGEVWVKFRWNFTKTSPKQHWTETYWSLLSLFLFSSKIHFESATPKLTVSNKTMADNIMIWIFKISKLTINKWNTGW